MGLLKTLYLELMSAGFHSGSWESCNCWLSLRVPSFKAVLLFRSILVEVGESQADLAFTVLVKMIQNKYILIYSHMLCQLGIKSGY